MSSAMDFSANVEPNDGWLAVEVRNGCPRALTALHRRYFARLVRLCNRQLNDHGLAEDIAQETMVRALRFLDSFDAARPMWPWLKVIAQRQCLDTIRIRNREQVYAELPEPDRAGPDDVETMLDRIILQALLADLPERQRLAVQLRYLDGCDRDTSATALGVNRNAFDQLLSRARLRLAAGLEGNWAGVALGALLHPIAGLRARSKAARQPLTAGFGGLATTVQFVAASIVAVVAGSVLVHPTQAEQSSATRKAPDLITMEEVTDRAAAMRGPRTSAPSTPTQWAAVAGVHGPGADVVVSVSKKPLSPGKTEHDRIVIVTPVTTITAGGYSERSPGSGVICGKGPIHCE